jgi:hypothetical protein
MVTKECRVVSEMKKKVRTVKEQKLRVTLQCNTNNTFEKCQNLSIRIDN